MSRAQNIAWKFIVVMAVLIGLYPISYLIADMSGGLLSTKPIDVLSSQLYTTMFYIHISTGGVALLIGWIQFLEKFRAKSPNAHRLIGMIYVICVIISGLSGLYIAQFATGGIVSIMGFSGLALFWLVSTSIGFMTISKGRVVQHKNWMLRSYALTLAAVMLRLWMPIFSEIFRVSPWEAYKLISWICWLPNLYVAEVLIQRRSLKNKKAL